ncbi:hypothetical protein [Segatella buccae]
MIGSIVGAGMKVGGAIFGGISASKAMKKMKQNIQNQMRENQDWYDRRYNEDATQRADAQRLLTMTEDSIRKRNQAAAGAQAVMGGTDESVAAAKEANSQALSDTTSNIAAAADQRKDAIEQQYMATKSNLNQQLNDLTQKKAQAISSAVQGVADAGSGIAGMF